MRTVLFRHLANFIGQFIATASLCSLLMASTISYTYDSLDRLTRVTYADGTAISYSYDSAGNRLTQVISNPSIAQPNAAVDKSNLAFSLPLGQTAPTSQSIAISNAGGGSLQWNASVSAGWLSVSPASGSDIGTLTVAASAAGLAQGNYSGNVFIIASASNTPLAIPVSLTVTALSGGGPAISSGGIVSSASYQPTFSRGMIATIFGSGLADGTAAADKIPLPTTLAGASVTVNGVAAPLFYVSPGQINFQIPFEAPLTGNGSIVVTRDGVPSSTATVALAFMAPSIFTYQRAPGVTDPVIVHASSGQLVTPCNPAVSGEFLTVYGTGMGDVTPIPTTGAGSPASPPASSSGPGWAVIGGLAAHLSFTGLTPGSVGLAQFNLQVPDNLPPGSTLPLVTGFGSTSSQTVQLYVLDTSTASTQLTGRVLWNGSPLSGVGVELKAVGDYNQLPLLACGTSGADGRFTLQGVPAGQAQVALLSPSEDYWDGSIAVTIVDGQANDVGDIVLQKKLQLVSPADRSVLSTVTPSLQWSPFPGVSLYYVYVYNSVTQERVFLQSTTATQLTISSGLTAGAQYIWQVQTGPSLAYSESRSFSIASGTSSTFSETFTNPPDSSNNWVPGQVYGSPTITYSAGNFRIQAANSCPIANSGVAASYISKVALVKRQSGEFLCRWESPANLGGSRLLSARCL